jgi:hypothetical protein
MRGCTRIHATVQASTVQLVEDLWLLESTANKAESFARGVEAKCRIRYDTFGLGD